MSYTNEIGGNLEKAIETLTERERIVITKRFGLFGNPAQTLEEVAREFKVTTSRVSQIQAKAIRKLRHPSRIRVIKEIE